MARPLMPKATAVWLLDNTALTFEQIAEFCGMHLLEVQAIADGEVAIGMQGLDPVAAGELTKEEIDRCVADSSASLKPAEQKIPQPKARPKGARYTPLSKRQVRPDGIAWLLKNYPELSDGQISKLVGTTKPTINSVRDKTHWNSPNIKPQNPVGLGLCSEPDLEKAVTIARASAGTVHAPAAVEEPAQPEVSPLAAMPPAATPLPETPATPLPETPAAALPETPAAPAAPASEEPAPAEEKTD